MFCRALRYLAVPVKDGAHVRNVSVDGNGEITVSELDTYLTDRVRELTNGAQTPIQTRPPGVPIFTFMRVAKPAK